MVFVGLIVTSCGFFIPAIIAIARKRRRDACRAGALAVSSIAYHGTLHPIAHLLDACIAHSCAMAYLKESWERFQDSHKTHDAIAFVNLTGACIVYFFKSKFNKHPNSCYWHLGLHVFSQATWIYYVLM
jgi:hypothetical protein